MSNKTKLWLVVAGVIILLFGFVSVAKSYQTQIEELRKDLNTSNDNYREALKRNGNLETDLGVCQIKAKLFDALQNR